MQIRFLKQYGMYHPGMATDLIPGGVADLLIRRNIAIEEPAAVPVQSPSLVDVGQTITSDSVDLGTEQRSVEGTEETPKSARQRNRR